MYTSDPPDLEDRSGASCPGAGRTSTRRRPRSTATADRDDGEPSTFAASTRLVDLAPELAQLRLDVVAGDLAVGHRAGVRRSCFVLLSGCLRCFAAEVPDEPATTSSTTTTIRYGTNDQFR